MHTLRKVYGQHLAGGCAPEEKLSNVLNKLDEPSVSKLVHDHEHTYVDKDGDQIFEWCVAPKCALNEGTGKSERKRCF